MEELKIIAELGPGATQAAIAFFVSTVATSLIWGTIVGSCAVKILNMIERAELRALEANKKYSVSGCSEKDGF